VNVGGWLGLAQAFWLPGQATHIAAVLCVTDLVSACQVLTAL
jgi:hypothetical protein